MNRRDRRRQRVRSNALKRTRKIQRFQRGETLQCTILNHRNRAIQHRALLRDYDRLYIFDAVIAQIITLQIFLIDPVAIAHIVQPDWDMLFGHPENARGGVICHGFQWCSSLYRHLRIKIDRA